MSLSIGEYENIQDMIKENLKKDIEFSLREALAKQLDEV